MATTNSGNKTSGTIMSSISNGYTDPNSLLYGVTTLSSGYTSNMTVPQSKYIKRYGTDAKIEGAYYLIETLLNSSLSDEVKLFLAGQCSGKYEFLCSTQGALIIAFEEEEDAFLWKTTDMEDAFLELASK